MKAIAAVSENWGIGKGNALLFSIPEDMKFFRTQTAGSVVIMGRKTLESFPGSKPLSGRVNIVLSKNPDFKKEGAIVVSDPKQALSEAARHGDKKVFVIGGGSIYALFLDKCDQCLITKVAGCPDADSFFPNLDALPQWEETGSTEEKESGGVKYRFTVYNRRKQP